MPGALAKKRAPKNGSSLSQAVRSAERKGMERASRDSAGPADPVDQAGKERCLLFIKSIDETAKSRHKSNEDIYAKPMVPSSNASEFRPS